MKKERGITLVSLVVTIIILIILAGVSINSTLGENGIITISKQAKENIELAKIEEETMLNELYTQLEAEGGEGFNIYIEKLAEFKKAIADYIEEAGGIKPEATADTTTFGDSIKGILKEATKDATATAEDIAEGKTAYVDGNLITGTASNSNGTNTLSFQAEDWSSSDINATSVYDISNFNTIKLTVSKDRADGTINISTNNKTLLSTNCSSMSTEYTFDVSNDATLRIRRMYTYGILTIKISGE